MTRSALLPIATLATTIACAPHQDEDAIPEDTPAEDTPAEDTPAEDAPAEDEADDGACDAPALYFPDLDADGYGDDGAEPVKACDRPEGTAEIPGDCDDTDPTVHPGMIDFCDGIDQDCDGAIDEDASEGEALVSFTGDGVDLVDLESGAIQPLLEAEDARAANSSADLGDGVVLLHRSADGFSRFDACEGSYTDLGDNDDLRICGMATGPDGEVYGLDTEDDRLVRLAVGEDDVAIEEIGSTGLAIGDCALAYDCAHDRMVALSVDDDVHTARLMVVDLESGAAELMVELDDEPEWNGAGMVYDAETDLFVIMMKNGLYSADPDTGELELLAEGSGNDLVQVDLEQCEA